MSNKYALFFNIFFVLVLFPCCDLFDHSLEETEKREIIPQNVGIDIPGSLSSDEEAERFKSLTGDSVYSYLRYYVYLSENANLVLQKTYNRLRSIDTQGITEFSFTGLDGFTKLVSLKQNYEVEADTFDFYMEIFDQTYSNIALKAIWNENPLNQIILFQPSKLNHLEMKDHPDAMVKIEYSIPLQDNQYDTIASSYLSKLSTFGSGIYMPDNILITIGKKASALSITGSVNVPKAYIFDITYTGGRNWTFLANADEVKNIASAQIALAPSYLENTENIFTEYSVHKVFADELRISRPDLAYLSDDELFVEVGIDPSELQSPVFYDISGFLSAGETPSGYESLLNFDFSEPYIPIIVRDSTVSF